MSTVRKEYMQGSFTRGLLVFVISGAIAFALFYQVHSYVFTDSTSAAVVDRSVAVESTAPNNEVIIPDTTLTEENSSLSNLEVDDIEGTPDSEDVLIDLEEAISNTSVNLGSTTNELLAFSIINQDGSVILDLRSAEKYATGWIRTSTNYDVDTFSASDFVAGGNYILVCETGTCSDAQILASKVESTVGSIALLDGGFTGWENEGGYRVMRSE
jgi:rhodanese-related sulfurtransferase